jgi:hypothetical protein
VRDKKGSRLDPFEFDLQLFGGSSAGGNLIWELLLLVAPSTAAVSTPTTGYGTIGLNDSGARLFSGRGFTKPSFQICPPPPTFPYASGNSTALASGYSVSVYYTLDKTLNTILNNSNQGAGLSLDGSTQLPPGSWALLPANADETGTGVDANPMTSGTNPILSASRSAAAFRVVVTTVTATPSNGIAVYALWVP